MKNCEFLYCSTSICGVHLINHHHHHQGKLWDFYKKLTFVISRYGQYCSYCSAAGCRHMFVYVSTLHSRMWYVYYLITERAGSL